jgi:hypothetical protein
MSDEEFLARWSRRKQEAVAGHAALPLEGDAEAQARATSPDARDETAHSEPDLSSLPPIESIDASTDITAFLRKGIPRELSRAALRRAWSADPTIRDFVGPAENAWDFNDPHAMPGFGPLDYSPEQVEALVHRIVGGVRQAAERLGDAPAEQAEGSPRAEMQSTAAASSLESKPNCTSPDSTSSNEPASGRIAPQSKHAAPPDSDEPPVRRRTHGGALPR